MTPPPYKPVAYDKSIRTKGRNFEAPVRMDDRDWPFERHSIQEAQKLLACFPDDVFEGPNVQPSVFFKGVRCETRAM